MLRGLPRVTNENLIVGHGTFDDAGVYALNAEQALVQTIDLFPPVINDPYLYGQIAAANALSDVYAMGGQAITALGVVCFPLGQLPLDVLGEIMKGGESKVSEAGAVIVGGHSISDPEIKFGLSVTGIVHPKRVASNSGARPGDVLILTKPLGMGPITTAYRMDAISEEDMRRAAESMAVLNKAAAEAMVAVGINDEDGVHAATDITGFGLLGHARNIAEASKVTLSFRASKVPIFEGATEFAAKDMVSGAMKQNEALLNESVALGAGVAEASRRVFYDSETSGGLLICVSPKGATRLAEELKARGVQDAVEVGVVEVRGEKALKVNS